MPARRCARAAVPPETPRRRRPASRSGSAAAPFLASSLRDTVSNAAGVGLRRSWSTTAAAVLDEIGLADAGLRQHEMDIVRRFEIAGDGSSDGAGLFIARQQQERRRAAVALDPDGIEARL